MKIKAYVKKGCVDKSRTPHEAGTTPDLDKKLDKKLWDLKLVEDYDVKKHGLPKGNDAELQAAKSEIVKLNDEIKSLKDDDGDKKLEAANEALGVANEKIVALETANEALEAKLEEPTSDDSEVLLAKIEKLTGFVNEAIELPKGRVPAGYSKD